MKNIQLRIYRYWQYFRLGFSKYLSYPFSIINFLTISFLYLERIPWLSIHFSLFVVIAVSIALPLGTILGWFDMRKSRIHSTEIEVSIQSNPMQIHVQRVVMETSLTLYRRLGVEPSPEWMALYRYWKRLDKGRWRPS